MLWYRIMRKGIFTLPVILFCAMGQPSITYADLFTDLDEPGFDMSAERFSIRDEKASEKRSHRTSRWQMTLAGGISKLSGYTYPDFSYMLYGYSHTISNVTFSDGFEAEGGLYYQVHPLLQVGVVGGYSFDHEHIEYVGNFFGNDYFWKDRLEISHASGVLRLGQWYNRHSRLPWRPFLEGGLGWYNLTVRRSWWFQSGSYTANWGSIYESSNDYMGARIGAGAEVEVYPSGVIGAQATYVDVFTPIQNLKYTAFTLRFSYLF